MAWAKLETARHLQKVRDAAVASHRPVLVHIDAEWCTQCKWYAALFERPNVRSELARFVTLVLDTSRRERRDLRDVIGAIHGVQPQIVFLASNGEPRRELAIVEWHGDRSEEILLERLRAVP